MKIKCFVGIVVMFATINVFSISTNSKVLRNVSADSIRESGAPIFTKQGVILTLQTDTKGEATLFTNLNGWQKPLHFQRSMYDVPYCYIKYPPETKDFLFRINIGGYWVETPMKETLSVFDNYGNALCKIVVPKQMKFYQSIPIIKPLSEDVKEVTFRIHAPKADNVNLLCSSLGYSSFAYKMEKVNSNYWEVILPLGKGQYGYYYKVDGKKVIDIENVNKTNHGSVGRVSTFTID